ncbi:hypothetical protein Cni_G22264 [Canna indica]|uniref:RING-type domain-containing protein n=1 Tax=Canna indica TaxID=4628 RepID=A0AAQ3KRK4_9LILI|nr:hypothetical protein Cni_G22264 [Canna indica]
MARIDRGRPLPLLAAIDTYSAEIRRTPPPPPSDAAKPKAGVRLLSFFLKGVVMVAALTLFFLFAGVAAIVLIHFFVASRALRHRRPIIRPPVAADTAMEGLSPALLKGLPWFDYSGMSAAHHWPSPDCAVCLEGFNEGERCRALPPCGHVFHVACVDRWLLKSPGCPICRAPVGTVSSEKAIWA